MGVKIFHLIHLCKSIGKFKYFNISGLIPNKIYLIYLRTRVQHGPVFSSPDPKGHSELLPYQLMCCVSSINT